MMNTKEKKTGTVVALSVLCCILTVLLGSGLLVSLSVRHASQEHLVSAAMEKLPLEELQIDSTTSAEFILKEFIQDERVTEEQVRTVMQQGTFSGFAADLSERYESYLNGNGAFPQLHAEDLVGLIEENQDLILRETGLEFLEPDKVKLRDNAAPLVSAWNRLDKGIEGMAVRSAASVWLPVVLGLLLMAVLVWMIVFYIRGGYHAGSALKVYSIALLVPCVLLLTALVLTDALGTKEMTFIESSMPMLYGNFLPFAGVGAAICAVIFCIGLLCCGISEKRAKKAAVPMETPAPEEVSAPEETSAPANEPAESEAKRQFCRNCGQPLVNPDAKFCYKCGNVQEQIKPEE